MHARSEGFEKSEELGIEDEEEMDMYILHHYSPGEKSDYDSAAALNHVGLGFERLSLDPSDERRKFHAHIYMSNPRGGGFPDLGGEFPIPEGKDKLNWLAVPLIAIQEGWGQKFWQRKAKLGKLKGWQFNALGCFFRKYLATLQRFNLHTLVMEAPEQKGKETDIVYRNPIPYTTYGWITEQRPQKVTETDEAPTERVVAFYDQLIKTAKSISVVSPMEVDFEQDLSKRYRATHSVFSKIAEKLFDEGVEADERMNEKADALPVEVDKGSQKVGREGGRASMCMCVGEKGNELSSSGGGLSRS
uniref:Uncharacterized protein n=1 Tax=Chromera velia CCMP2878 TaxID=1169474 RepID=A0A0G4IA60_9ALVE|eukprot:Cvel_12379.t1-p1 / transcript=Cvel_12379.t1 / gene=Cvel_12379 / organism=Chromera_velia_CCMP2878 / gene_product=hypothetical protein / transcript_product=hypothetical protein / location=Cvel_scaffold808:48009-51157(+) / protein_length=302 / sequence_SO=supercontig / SO=protein_coding / is_pseudo=false